MPDQAEMQSNTVDAAADAMDSMGLFSDEPAEMEAEAPAEAEVEEGEAEQVEAEAEEQAEETHSEEEEAETEEQDDENEEGSEITTLSELAEALDMSEDDIKNNLTVTLDEQGDPIPLGEALSGFMLQRDYTRKTQELAEQRTQFEGELVETRQVLDQQHHIAARVISHAKQAADARLQAIMNNAAMKASDPQGWATAYQEAAQEVQGFDQLIQSAAAEYAQTGDQLDSKTQAQMKEQRDRELMLLKNAIPEFEQVKPEMVNYLLDGVGFTKQEVESVGDHRLLVLARKAMLYDQSKTKKDVAKKRIKAAPKAQKPSAKKAVNLNADRAKKAQSRLRKSGRVEDAAAVIESLI